MQQVGKCPRCKRQKLERLIGPGAGILFKGGGFYQTDYRSESYKRGESAEKTPEKDGGKGADKTAAETSAPKDSAAKPDGGAGGSKPAKAAQPPRKKPD